MSDLRARLHDAYTRGKNTSGRSSYYLSPSRGSWMMVLMLCVILIYAFLWLAHVDMRRKGLLYPRVADSYKEKAKNHLDILWIG